MIGRDKSKRNKDKKEWSTMRVPCEFKRRFRIMAAEHNMNMSEFARFLSRKRVSSDSFKKGFERVEREYKNFVKKNKDNDNGGGGFNFRI